MIDREVVPAPKPINFEDVVDTVSKLVPPNTVGTSDEYGEIEFPGWDGNIRAIDLEPVVATEVGLGQIVNATVIGDYESGITFILRSRNPFNSRRYGILIQPTIKDERSQGFEVWQTPAQKPKRGQVYWGSELLDRSQAKHSSPEVSDGFINSLRQKVQ